MSQQWAYAPFSRLWCSMTGGKIIPIIAAREDAMRQQVAADRAELMERWGDANSEIIHTLGIVLDKLDDLRKAVDELKQRAGRSPS